MNRTKANFSEISAFAEAVYPGYGELQLATGCEREIISDAVAIINAFREALESIAAQCVGDKIEEPNPDYQVGYEAVVKAARDALLCDPKPEHVHQWTNFVDEPNKRECASCGVIEDRPADRIKAALAKGEE